MIGLDYAVNRLLKFALWLINYYFYSLMALQTLAYLNRAVAIKARHFCLQ